MSNPPSLRLNLSAAAVGGASSNPAASNTAAATAPPPKRPKRTLYTPPPETKTVTPANPADLRLMHQRTALSWAYDPHTGWQGAGTTTLYLRDTAPPPAVGTIRPLALHARNSLTITAVSVQTLEEKPAANTPKTTTHIPWHTCGVSYSHADALSCVLQKPTHAVEPDETPRCQADTQCSRGAVGMTNALRAASIASHFGELRLSYNPPNTVKVDTNKNAPPNDTTVELWLQELLQESPCQEPHRQAARRKRFAHVAKQLAQPSALALKVEISFSYAVLQDNPDKTLHFGGWHADAQAAAPHVYTTSGVYGDGQGPRTWVPCLDSASVMHRASHEIVVRTTAPAAAALQCVGAGETTGVAYAVGHTAVVTENQSSSSSSSSSAAALAKAVGSAKHVEWWKSLSSNASNRMNTSHASSHVVPPDELRYGALYVTHVWTSATFGPVPVRSLGWAIGPWALVEDPEYFAKVLAPREEDEEEDEVAKKVPKGDVVMKDATDETGTVNKNGTTKDKADKDPMDSSYHRQKSREARWAAFLASVRQRGEGIRQAYFLPRHARAHVFAQSADWSLVSPATSFRLPPLPNDLQAWEDTVTRSTVGVPHRALSLLRDVLALPTYRTVSYTQIWIPNAVDGGCTSGALADCPEVALNPFLGGAIFDARLLPPPRARLPFAQGGGRVLQYLQARAALRGWIKAALPLGGDDDVGFGYLHALVESLLFSLYERGHGGYGEGGGPGSFFFSRRYAPASGLNSPQLDFLPIRNMEDMTLVVGGVAAVPIEERQTDHLWRSTINGSESHTSALDEFQVRSMIERDVVEALERGVDKDDGVPTGSMGWFGSHLSLTFLSSNAASSSLLGCGAVELMHPVSGVVYQHLKTNAFRGIVEGRAGIANFVRLVRAAFIAAHLGDMGEKELKLPQRRGKRNDDAQGTSGPEKSPEEDQPKPPFVVCVNEILSKRGLTHTLFTRALQNICGRLREGVLAGTLVDVERHAVDPRSHQPFVDPEGFPNSYVRAASTMYLRVGVQVENSRDSGTAAPKGVQCQLYAEPIVPRGGVAFGGPITVRIVENEGQFRENVKQLVPDGSRRDWGAQMLFTKPVTTTKAQTAASGAIEKSQTAKDAKPASTLAGDLAAPSTGGVFTDSNFHVGGYQALELIRLTNLTPLLWVRVDPLGMYGGKIVVSQPDACMAEQLFYDGDASAQLDSIRALAERPLSIQSPPKVSVVHDVSVSELPIRVIGDCLRGSPALHSSLPHTPIIRANAALAMAQWQNNKGPQSREITNPESWIGLNLLLQYFKERFYSSSVVMPVKFTRIAFKKNEAETRAAAAASGDSGIGVPKATHDDGFYYFDSLGEGRERAAALSEAEDVETEEDEEYRVRSACITALASIRAKDGKTPPAVIKFLETVLEAEDASMMSNVVHPDDDMVVEKTFRKMKADANDQSAENEEESEAPTVPSLPYISSVLVADTLLALCHINTSPATYTDPASGRILQAKGRHPVARLMELTLDWLEWELYREKIRRELHLSTRTGISGNCYDLVAPCALLALANLAILKQCTTSTEQLNEEETAATEDKLEAVAQSGFFAQIFDSKPHKNDLTRAASAQAFTSLCCAADRIEIENSPPLGLLTALEFLLERIIEPGTSPSLRHSLAALMIDACTGKISSMQRVGAIAGRNDLVASAARFFLGPLGASHGGDNGSALLMSVSTATHPSASAVNDGARRGLRLISRAGHPKASAAASDAIVIRIATFATTLWRTMNGEKSEPTLFPSIGVCAYDGKLRCALLALWQWLWPKGCFAVLRVQDWRSNRPAGAEKVMSIYEDEMEAAASEESSLSDISRLVEHEIDRQTWRGEMAIKAYEISRTGKPNIDLAAAEQGLGSPLPPIARDVAFKQGGWSASWAKQRREAYLDGGSTGTKLRLKVGGR